MFKTAMMIVILLGISSGVLADDLVDKPLPTTKVKLIDLSTRKPVWMTLPVKHKTADKAWWTATAISAALTVADVENTVYCLKVAACQEDNWLYGRRPGRARLWSVSGPMFALTTWASYRAKRSEDAATAFGARRSWTRWWIAPLANAATHGVGVAFTLANTRR